MSKVQTARKNHGLCEKCFRPILPGQSYRTSAGMALPHEQSNFTMFGGKVVSFKRHDGCPYPEHRKASWKGHQARRSGI